MGSMGMEVMRALEEYGEVEILILNYSWSL